MATAPKRRSGAHEATGTRVWCGVERRDVPIERCLDCGRLTDIVLKGDVRYVRCRSEASPDDPPGPPPDLDW